MPAPTLKLEVCELCGRATLNAEVHHIRPKEHKGNNHPDNLIELCGSCHNDVHVVFERLERGLQLAVMPVFFARQRDLATEGWRRVQQNEFGVSSGTVPVR